MALSLAPRPVYLRCELKVGVWNGNTWPAYYTDALNFTKVELTSPTQEKEELISNMTSNFGAALDSQQKPTEAAQVAIEFSTMPPHLLAMVLGADVSEQTQSTAEVAAEVVNTVMDVWVPLVNGYIAPRTVGTPINLTKGDNTPVDANKYEIDHVNGMIKATHSDAAGTGMKLTYHKANATWEEYLGGQAKSAYVRLIGSATDMYTGHAGRLDIYRAQLAPSGTIDMVAGGYFSGALGGTMIAPVAPIANPKSTPFAFHARVA